MTCLNLVVVGGLCFSLIYMLQNLLERNKGEL